MGLGIFENSLTQLLQRYSGGDQTIAEELFREIFPALRRLAAKQLSREHSSSLLVTPTELINEFWIRNLRRGGWTVKNRDHFYAIVAIAMRQVLIDMARARLAAIRGGDRVREPLERGNNVATPNNLERIIEIGQLTDQLERRDAAAARIVDLRYFAGYTVEEIAEITNLDVRHVRYRWDKAQKWLKSRLQDQPAEPSKSSAS